SLKGAEAYAAWAGKRLPTPYEWCLAALGPKGISDVPDWVKRYIKDRQEAWKRIHERHAQLLSQFPDLTQNVVLDFVPRHAAIPLIARLPQLASISQS